MIGNVGIEYDTINDRHTLTSTFAGGPGTPFVTDGIKPCPWMTPVGIGIGYLTKTDAEIAGRYEAEHRSSFMNQTRSLKARWRF